MMRSANPTLRSAVFQKSMATGAGTMTIQGTVNKSMILMFLLLISASWVWTQFFQSVPASWESAAAVSQVQSRMMGIATLGAIVGFVIAIITAFKVDWSPVTSPIYALCEGAFLGGVSAAMELQYPGIVIQAVALTFGTLFSLLLAYKSGLIKVTENFKLGVFAATGGIALIYVVTIILGLFGVRVPFIHESGPIGIGFSVFVVIIAALNLVMDFDFIENGEEMGAPKFMEWYGAFALLVTLVWLYLEILRLLAKIMGNRR